MVWRGVVDGVERLEKCSVFLHGLLPAQEDRALVFHNIHFIW